MTKIVDDQKEIHRQEVMSGSVEHHPEVQLVEVTFRCASGDKTVQAPVGLSLLEVARLHAIDLEGACEGSLACSTCHVVVDPSWYGKLGDPSVDEEDMLDLAWGLTDTSRLGCQIRLTPKMQGLVVTIPQQTRHLSL